MAADIISELSSRDLNEFKKDFLELMTVLGRLNKEYGKVSRNIDKSIKDFKEAINLCNEKYSGIKLKLKKTIEELKLTILIKEKSVIDLFKNVASRIEGLKAIGSTGQKAIPLEDADKFSRELDKVKDKLFVSYHYVDGTNAILFESIENGMIEMHYSQDITQDKSPEFKICAFYAVKEGVNHDINVCDRLAAFGFLEHPHQEKVKKTTQRNSQTHF